MTRKEVAKKIVEKLKEFQEMDGTPSPEAIQETIDMIIDNDLEEEMKAGIMMLKVLKMATMMGPDEECDDSDDSEEEFKLTVEVLVKGDTVDLKTKLEGREPSTLEMLGVADMINHSLKNRCYE